ncbi:MAG: 16S rRNA (adenine(1518)-N(6)/adenine(1519)-N(6))-dimethyltransferase RsmA [Candidatus Jorgensenbacteria bacterium]|nr:16S rRNA (adenine(1518)-N(6)/adenine(1519)-N(6))-dimethyltransferase RsmA [Candidatus Jorgensenbacteria bacterium]
MRAQKRYGQNFLKNPEKIRHIVESLDIQPGDIVVEIGPGHGELTERIMNYEVRIMGVEKDMRLAAELKKRFQKNRNIEIVCGDALKVLPKIISDYSLQTTHYKLVGNIPYYITGHLLRILGELPKKPSVIVLTVQKEVAERLAAHPPKMNLLAASVQVWAEPKIIEIIPRSDFSPQPKVDSAIIKLVMLPKDKSIITESYYPFIRALFKQPRKTVLNNLKTLEIPQETLLGLLKQYGVDPHSRPQDLGVQIIKNLARDSV